MINSNYNNYHFSKFTLFYHGINIKIQGYCPAEFELKTIGFNKIEVFDAYKLLEGKREETNCIHVETISVDGLDVIFPESWISMCVFDCSGRVSSLILLANEDEVYLGSLFYCCWSCTIMIKPGAPLTEQTYVAAAIDYPVSAEGTEEEEEEEEEESNQESQGQEQEANQESQGQEQEANQESQGQEQEANQESQGQEQEVNQELQEQEQEVNQELQEQEQEAKKEAQGQEAEHDDHIKIEEVKMFSDEEEVPVRDPLWISNAIAWLRGDYDEDEGESLTDLDLNKPEEELDGEDSSSTTFHPIKREDNNIDIFDMINKTKYFN